METCPLCGRAYGKRRRCYFCHPIPNSGRPRLGYDKSCEHCGKAFYTTPRQQAHPRRFCSLACKGAWQTEQYNKTWKDRFWNRVDRSGECWIWKGKVYPATGYGAASIRGLTVGAHRVSWEIANDANPGRFEVRHSCDNRLCVRPDHLSIGTAADNSADKIVRGRNKTLAEARCRAVRLLVDDGMDRSLIARVLRIKPDTIESIALQVT